MTAPRGGTKALRGDQLSRLQFGSVMKFKRKSIDNVVSLKQATNCERREKVLALHTCYLD